MELRSRLVLLGTMLLWGLVAFPGCSLLGGPGGGERLKAKAEVTFVESTHRISDCLHAEIARSHEELADSVLWFDRDSLIRVTPPTKKGAVNYHLHLLHRVQDRICDSLAKQDSKGVLELDLSRFDQPEELLVVSDGRRIVEDDSGPAGALRSGDARREEIPTPPYVLSFRLLPAEGQIETILSLRRHRWEIITPSGKFYLVTGSPNRRDHLVTFVDPAKAHSQLIAEDPYIYVPAQGGAIPPRLTVEVLSAGKEGRVWEKAATYSIPEGIDRLGEKPFVFRTSKRDLIAFGPPPRIDIVFPKDPAATSMPVQVVPKGLSEKDALRVDIACLYPAGPKGDSAVRFQSHDIAGSSKGETYSIDLGQLDPGSFPLISSLAIRSVVPWKLTSGRYAPEPAMGTSSVPLVAPAGNSTSYAKFLTPKFASHYDLVQFLGAGSVAKKGSSLLDSYLRSGGPDDPNMTPPPLPPGGGPGPGGGDGAGTPPGPGTTQVPGAGAGLGGGGGGPPSNCGCGKNGNACRNTLAPCKGTCGQGCPANGCCDPGNNMDGGGLLITKPCPPKGKSCGKSEAECKCPPHEWTREEIRAAVEAAIRANKFLSARYADMDGPANPVGFAPCHTQTHAADVVAHFWKDGKVGIGGPGLGQYHVTYHVDVIFKPCIGNPEDGLVIRLEPIKPNIIRPNQNPTGNGQLAVNTLGGTGSPLTGPTFTLELVDPTNPITTSLNPSIDPNTMIDVALAMNALGDGRGATIEGGFTNTLFADILHADLDTLLGIRSALNVRSDATSTAWLGRPVNVLNGPDSWTLSLPNSEWAIYQGGTGGGTTTPPPTTPPPTTPPPTTPPPTSTKPRS
jgi:hypothetical protein